MLTLANSSLHSAFWRSCSSTDNPWSSLARLAILSPDGDNDPLLWRAASSPAIQSTIYNISFVKPSTSVSFARVNIKGFVDWRLFEIAESKFFIQKIIPISKKSKVFENSNGTKKNLYAWHFLHWEDENIFFYNKNISFSARRLIFSRHKKLYFICYKQIFLLLQKKTG